MVKRTSIYLDREIDQKTLKQINWQYGSFSAFIREKLRKFQEKMRAQENAK